MTDTQATGAKWPLARIGIDGSCYTADDTGLAVDMHGWQSDHPIFAEVFQKHRPKLVCEIGTWKGASVLRMHKLAKSLGLETHFICIDTWLGSNATLWLEDDLRTHLQLVHGYPSMFRQFVHNVKAAGAQDCISPFPITSTAAPLTHGLRGRTTSLSHRSTGAVRGPELSPFGLRTARCRPLVFTRARASLAA